VAKTETKDGGKFTVKVAGLPAGTATVLGVYCMAGFVRYPDNRRHALTKGSAVVQVPLMPDPDDGKTAQLVDRIIQRVLTELKTGKQANDLWTREWDNLDEFQVSVDGKARLAQELRRRKESAVFFKLHKASAPYADLSPDLIRGLEQFRVQARELEADPKKVANPYEFFWLKLPPDLDKEFVSTGAMSNPRFSAQWRDRLPPRERIQAVPAH
jgi:hypothetical protein